MKISERTGLGIQVINNQKGIEPAKSFYHLQARLINGEMFPFSRLQGKKVVIVNVAGLCGYTPQYAELEELFRKYENLEVLAFPSNDFRNQEPGSNEDIAAFCQSRFNVSFRLFEKCHVKGVEKHEVFTWLSVPQENGWNHLEPGWNFWKYLIDEKGILQKVASPATKPQKLLD